MTAENEIYADWNPWHGCTKISPGCKYCYVYRQDEMYGAAEASSVCRRTGNFDLPVKRKRGGSYKIPPGRIVFTCFTSDFLLKDADEWRGECWKMMRERRDCWFYFFTTLLNHFYWFSGATIGGLVGSLLKFNTDGLDFVMTAMFTVIFLEQWLKEKHHISEWIGLGASIGCLLLFGADNFLIPTMICILVALTILRKTLEQRKEVDAA